MPLQERRLRVDGLCLPVRVPRRRLAVNEAPHHLELEREEVLRLGVGGVLGDPEPGEGRPEDGE